MRNIMLSPSILGYEPHLEADIEKIIALSDAGIKTLHIDVMRPPFIPNRTAFSDRHLAMICEGWIDDFFLDFHLMVNDPTQIFDILNNTIPEEKRKRCVITLHRESLRNHSPTAQDGLGRYAEKRYDLSEVIKTVSKDSPLYDKILGTQKRSENMLQVALKNMKYLMGYNVGIAAEPTGSISPNIIESADLVLIMSVPSGEGGQKFIPDTLDKIWEVRQRFPDKIIQVDGGIDAGNLRDVIAAGADNIVVGSYITGSKDPAGRVRELQALIKDIISSYEVSDLLSKTH